MGAVEQGQGVVIDRDALTRIRTSMALLQQNAEGCATNHYGNDHELFGLPGWLADTRADLDRLTATLASPSQTEEQVEAVARRELANIDKVNAECPANRQRLGDKLCPTCKAGPSEGCRRDVLAMLQMVHNLRAALSNSQSKEAGK